MAEGDVTIQVPLVQVAMSIKEVGRQSAALPVSGLTVTISGQQVQVFVISGDTA